MLDNSLTWSTPLIQGQALLIEVPTTSSTSFWSPAIGVNPNNNNMVAKPQVVVCPPGTYAVYFNVVPSMAFDAGSNGSAWVGNLIMTCSDNALFTINTTSIRQTYPEGSVFQNTGFTAVHYTSSGGRVDSLFGVGILGGTTRTWSCPSGTVITGVSAGASPAQGVYSSPWMQNLQFLCQGKCLLLP